MRGFRVGLRRVRAVDVAAFRVGVADERVVVLAPVSDDGGAGRLARAGGDLGPQADPTLLLSAALETRSVGRRLAVEFAVAVVDGEYVAHSGQRQHFADRWVLDDDAQVAAE